MIRRRGVRASPGIAIGPARLTEVSVRITERRILRSEREAELARLESAVDDAQEQLDRLHGQLDAAPGSTGHELIDLHRVILRSPELGGEARRFINDECFGAEWAVTRALERIRSVFARLDVEDTDVDLFAAVNHATARASRSVARALEQGRA